MTDSPLVGIYFDTNVFIALLDSPSAMTGQLWRFFGPEAGRTHQIVTSELTLAECLVGALEDALNTGDYTRHDLFMDSLVTKGIEQIVLPVDRTILVRAALARAQLLRLTSRKIKLPDAIHIATALQAGCVYVLTGDRSLRGAVNAIAAGKDLQGAVPRPSLEMAVDLDVDSLAALAARLNIQ